MPDLLGQTEHPANLLDKLIPDKPALILDHLGHGAWANSQALAIVGFDRIIGEPQGGLIDRDRTETPSGIVCENAQQTLLDATLPPNDREQESQTLQGIKT